MKSALAGYKTSHLVALVCAFAVHAGILVTSMLPSNPIVINQQAIQVSFVAPNSINSKNENNSHKQIALNENKENAIKQKLEKKEQAQSQDKNKSFVGKQTSGRVDENATATRAAESEPVFDAAYLNNPAPYYPVSAKRSGVQGKVLLSVVVKADGTPLSVDVSRSSGSSTLDVAALDAVKQWRFVPAKRSGQPVQANVIVPVEFKII